MSVKFSPLPLAPVEYSRDSESLFRRSVENSLLNVYSELDGAVSAQHGPASPASKREMLLSVAPSVTFRNTGIVGAIVGSGATPNVDGLSRLVISSSGTLTITDFLGGVPGQTVTVFNASSAVVTIKDTSGGGSNIRLSGGGNLVFGSSASDYYSNLTLEKSVGGDWVEVARMIR